MLTTMLPSVSGAHVPLEDCASKREPNWFAVRVKSKHEKAAANAFRGKGYEELLPLYERRKGRGTVKRTHIPLFPGYVFCRFDPRYRLPVLTTPGVLYVVSNGATLSSIDEAEIEAIRRCVQPKANPQPWSYLREGQLVEVRSGPLCGLRGLLLVVKGQRRLVVSVELLRRSVAAELDSCCVVPV